MSTNFTSAHKFTRTWFAGCVGLGLLLSAWGVFERVPALSLAGVLVIGAALIPVFTYERLLFTKASPRNQTSVLLAGFLLVLLGIVLLATSQQTAALMCIGAAGLLSVILQKMKKQQSNS